MTTIYDGDNPAVFARRKARYGHRDWLVWTGRDGKRYAALRTVEGIKQAMLATGTQGYFTCYVANTGTGMVVTWQIAAMWLRNVIHYHEKH